MGISTTKEDYKKQSVKFLAHGGNFLSTGILTVHYGEQIRTLDYLNWHSFLCFSVIWDIFEVERRQGFKENTNQYAIFFYLNRENV